MSQIAKYTGVIESTTAAIANAIVERDSSADVYANIFRAAAGLRSGGHLYLHSSAKTAAYTATSADCIVLVDATAAATTITLPAAAGASGQLLIVKKTDSSANAVTVDGSGSETIDGATTKSLAAQYDVAIIFCDGTAWHVLA